MSRASRRRRGKAKAQVLTAQIAQLRKRIASLEYDLDLSERTRRAWQDSAWKYRREVDTLRARYAPETVSGYTKMLAMMGRQGWEFKGNF